MYSMCARFKNGAVSHLSSLSLFELLLSRLLLGSVSSGRGRVQFWLVFTAGRLHGNCHPGRFKVRIYVTSFTYCTVKTLSVKIQTTPNNTRVCFCKPDIQVILQTLKWVNINCYLQIKQLVKMSSTECS